MKLLITRPLPDPVVRAAEAFAEVTVRDSNVPMGAGEVQTALADFDAILPTLGDAFGAEVYAGDVAAKMIANFGVGYNHIDVEAATAAGCKVSNTPGVLTDATADMAMTLLLMSARRAAEGERMVRAGQWDGWHPTQLLGQHVTGKTLGIVGMGRIGQAIARRCHFGFGMDVVFHNRSTVSNLDVPARQLDGLLPVMEEGDFVVVAVPGGAGTRHLIDAEALAVMQPHAHLVNIARGDVIDERALIAVLEAGRIGGAGLDVYENEPEVPEALKRLNNVTLLPHLGTNALEVRTAMGMLAVDNLRAFAEGRDLPNPV